MTKHNDGADEDERRECDEKLTNSSEWPQLGTARLRIKATGTTDQPSFAIRPPSRSHRFSRLKICFSPCTLLRRTLLFCCFDWCTMDPVLTAIRNKNSKIIVLPVEQAPMPHDELRMCRKRKRRNTERRKADGSVAHAQPEPNPTHAQKPAKKKSRSSVQVGINEFLERGKWIDQSAELKQTMAERQQKGNAVKKCYTKAQ